MYIRYIKRILDIVLSFVGLILSSWLFLIIIAAIEIDDPGPVPLRRKGSAYAKSILIFINSAV